MPPQKKVAKGHRGEVPSLLIPGKKGKKTIKTLPSDNTRDGGRAQQKGGEEPIDASPSASKGEKNVQAKKGKRLKTMLAVREEADEGQFLLSPPTAFRKTAGPSPMVAAATGTLIYLLC